MSFSTQPNEMLHMILNQTGIPLPQRMRLRAVSRRFRATLEDGLQQESSLVIRVVCPVDMKNLKRGYWKVQPNDLLFSVSNFTKKKAIAFIQRLFPRLTELTIDSNSLIAWRKATELLRLYARTLTSLKVCGYPKNLRTRESVIRSLGEVINSIATLTTFYLTNGNFSDSLLFYLVPTLPHLGRFTFDAPIHQYHATLIAATLSYPCTHLHLKLNNFVTTFPFHGAINLTHLHLEYTHDTVLQFVLQLPQLTTLILYDTNRPDLDTLLQKIHPLSQVTQLTFKGISYRRPLEPPASKAFTFPSIKRLTLQLAYLSSSFKPMDYLSSLAIWFPKLATCAIYCPERYREGILAIQEGLPFTVELLDHLETTF